jgi:REP element-mobilizing transposase RayT
MSQPHEYRPGTYYEVVRRCTERAHKLTPNQAPRGKYTSSIKQLYQYATACFAALFGIEILAVCLMSNHMHEIVFDRYGLIAKFLQRRNAMFANMVKVRSGLSGSVFEKSDGKYNRLEGARAVAEKIAYVLANPVAAGLVASPEEWPGFVSSVADLAGRSVVVERPREYVAQTKKKKKKKGNPLQVTFQLGIPAEAKHLFCELSALTSVVAADLAQRVKSARRLHSGRFSGRTVVLATSPHARATSYEVFGGRVPRFTTAGDLEAAKRVIAEIRAFRTAHRRSFEAVRGGKRRVIFPAGTGKMHFTYGYPREEYPMPSYLVA